MNNKSPVVFIDSGLGGICVLNEWRKILKNEDFIYAADTLNSPFGNKSKKKIISIIIKNCLNLCKTYNPKAIVLACNTATAAAVNTVRKKFDITVVGIEPAIKPAAINKTGRILVLSTAATLNYSPVLKKYRKQKNIKFLALKKLASLIDSNLSNLDAVFSYLNKSLKRYKNTDSVVLGCTHYSFIKPQLQKVLSCVNFFESCDGVANRLFEQLKTNNLQNPKKQRGKTTILVTKEENNFKNRLEKYLM